MRRAVVSLVVLISAVTFWAPAARAAPGDVVASGSASIVCDPPTDALCFPSYDLDFSLITSSRLRADFTAGPETCEPVTLRFTVDGEQKAAVLVGPEEHTSVDLGDVLSGVHLLSIQAEWFNNDCGELDGLLHSWGGDVAIVAGLPLDTDGDGVPDDTDNCPSVQNGDQADFDSDGFGDACDFDNDNDGVDDPFDNCPLTANPGQEDTDGDGTGDVCDPTPLPDTDGDGIPDANDNCPAVANTDQTDSDSDGIGDVCDEPSDVDQDGVPDVTDNCVLDFNPDQLDSDGDGLGDVCDPTPLPGPQRSDYPNAARFCDAERAFLGINAFREKYGGELNAYGRCVGANK
jgi:hypothetical protein